MALLMICGTGGAPAASLSDIQLRGTIVFNDAARSLALLDLGGEGMKTLRIGAQVPGVGQLTQIGRRGVRFLSNGNDVEFSFNDSALRTGGQTLALATGAGATSDPLAGTAGYRVDNPHGFVMPNDGYVRSKDPAKDRLDATPHAGQEIDTTVWDAPGRQIPRTPRQNKRPREAD